ncbi:MAG: mannonate dehydratase [Candidatus Latescibacteria bacterium]|nr:mannonate dehydratase [Candidatus Latescibacterota bacterium]
MELALSIQHGQDDQLIFAQQLGADSVVVAVDAWEAETLKAARNRVERSGLKLAGLEAPPAMAPVLLGKPGGDQQLAGFCQGLRNAGEAGIGLVSCDWRAPVAAQPQPVGRGKALVAPVPAPAATPAWEALEKFLAQAGPVAQAAGVRLACRAGAGFLRQSRRLLGLVPALDLDLAELAGSGSGAEELISAAGAKLAMVHSSNLRQQQQAFLDEGEISLPKAMRALVRGGFSGPLRAALPPGMVEDTAWGHKGRAFDLGYLRAILQVIERTGQ